MFQQWRLNNDNSLLNIKTILSEFSRLTKEPFLKKKKKTLKKSFSFLPTKYGLKIFILNYQILSISFKETNIFIFIFIFILAHHLIKYFRNYFYAQMRRFNAIKL